MALILTLMQQLVRLDQYICLTNPCHNGGKCEENPLAPCHCPKGYVGKYCFGKFVIQGHTIDLDHGSA